VEDYQLHLDMPEHVEQMTTRLFLH
jgi:hypothetical protein